MKPRPYQQSLIDEVKTELRKGIKSVCIVIGCGGGKSVIAGNIAKSATDKGNRVLFLVHRRELCEQISQTFSLCRVDMRLCTIGMVQTLTRKIDAIQEPKLIIVDETHHVLSKSYTKIIEHFPNAILLGFTATPTRLNEGGLGKVFKSLVKGVSTRWLIDNNYLADYRYFSARLVETSGFHVKNGEYDQLEVADAMESGVIYGETVKNYLNIANGKKAIVYCASIKSSIDTADEFNSQGISAAHVDGKTPICERNNIMIKFRKGIIKVLCNVGLFDEGVDVPDCDCTILLRPTKSLTLYIQQAMRSMRYMEGKTAIIIDHVGNVFNHGLPDADREWTLESRKKKNEEKNEVFIRECPVCFSVISPKLTQCPNCGEEFSVEEKEQKEVVDVILKELDKNEFTASTKYNEHRNIKTFEDMCKFQKAKGYKFGWCIRKCLELDIPVPSKYSFYINKFINKEAL